MPQTKVKAPKGITSISLDGVQYDADKKGVFTLPGDIDPGNLSPFGFKLADDDGKTEAEEAPQDPPAEQPPVEGAQDTQAN